MQNKPVVIIAIMILLFSICFSGCQEQKNQNGNQTGNTSDGNQQHNTTENKFLGDWEAINITPDTETWSFYANLTAENYLVQEFEDKPLSSVSWFNYTYDTTTLCFSTGSSPDSPNYFSICYSYVFFQNATRLTLSSNSIVIIELVKILPV